MSKKKGKGIIKKTEGHYAEWTPPTPGSLPLVHPKVEEDVTYVHAEPNKVLLPQVAYDAVSKDWKRLYPDQPLDKEMHYQLALRKHLAFEQQHPLVSGKLVFDMKATHGLPFDVIFGQIILERSGRINWVEFIDTALTEGWLINQIMVSVRAGMEDASIHREYIEDVIQRMKLYITKKFEVKDEK